MLLLQKHVEREDSATEGDEMTDTRVTAAYLHQGHSSLDGSRDLSSLCASAPVALALLQG